MNNDNHEKQLAIVDLSTAKTFPPKLDRCVEELMAQGKTKDQAYAICTASIKNSEGASNMNSNPKPETKIFYQKTLSDLLKARGFCEADSIFFSSKLISEIEEGKRESIIKRFQEAKNLNVFKGQTLEVDQQDDNLGDHKHDYVLMSLNFGENLIGITTKTIGAKNHLHVIDIVLDSAVRKIEAYMGYGQEESEEMETFHSHIFMADVKEIRKNQPMLLIRSKYYSEHKKEEEEEDREQKEKEKRNKKNYIDSFEAGTKTIGFSNQREAEAVLAQVCRFEESPEWCPWPVEILQEKVFSLVEKYFPVSSIFSDSFVAEFQDNRKRGETDPNAKVRNRPRPIFPSTHSKVKDNKDHFPTKDIDQARNALARVAQYKKKPSWWDGSLEDLKKEVRETVKKRFPKIDVTGLNEFFSLRMKAEGDAFLFSATDDFDCIREDAEVYARSCKGYDVDIVKISVDFDGDKTQFSSMGSFLFYDKNSKGMIQAGSPEIKMSEKDSEGNTVIEILRTGKYDHPEYGKLFIDTNMLSKIIKNFNSRVLDRDVSFDFNHEPDLPACAWVRKLSTARRDFKGQQQDVLLAHVQWTKRGEEAIRGGDYRYFSSEYVDSFIDKEDGTDYGITLKGGGLTNRPWIPGLKPISLSEKRDGIAFFQSHNN